MNETEFLVNQKKIEDKELEALLKENASQREKKNLQNSSISLKQS